VKELKIKCPSSGRGCEWVSELGNLQSIWMSLVVLLTSLVVTARAKASYDIVWLIIRSAFALYVLIVVNTVA